MIIIRKHTGGLWHNHRHEPVVDDNSNIVDFSDDNDCASFKFKQKIAGNNRTKHIEIIASLKYLISFWRTLEMPIINCKINLILTWSKNCFIMAVAVINQVPEFATADTKFYVPLVTLSTQDSAKLLEQ